MKQLFIVVISLAAFFNSCAQKKNDVSKTKTQKVMSRSIYDYTVDALEEGKKINFADFKDRKILIVNTASKCGFTPQYEDLEKLSKEFEGKLVVVGFPANNFGGQEPGTNIEIGAFCQKNYGVTFPLASKVSVKGEDMAPIFKFLTEKSLNGVKDTKIEWNFTKFLIDENGKLIDSFPSKVKPTDEEILKYLR
ncbi:glutathione peroxidase [Chryseobacterium oryzae]|uniref:Glutathione peroxidase n=1 Tax=Chryseobacterium oryzae TaxID=2929799 RepID=A0ABY4BMK0_9FLAO|nr:glutathione peroxidase [Chryseobacterium oryzae]UOE39467.1 glutathione peroxidase [Chryseobacterium oryzae]